MRSRGTTLCSVLVLLRCVARRGFWALGYVYTQRYTTTWMHPEYFVSNLRRWEHVCRLVAVVPNFSFQAVREQA